ncbi:MAG TPA: carboxylesterase [Clostridiaceae bacterium]|nr:carboxylesterase [Clostridiaceae bacterium]
MEHIYLPGEEPRLLVLFHGTGGTEKDLIPLAKEMDPKAHILSIRGNAPENGMNRYFRRLVEGVFDEEDIRFRAKELVDFLNTAKIDYTLGDLRWASIGYSNGANIIAALHYLHGDVFEKSILLHPMVPLQEGPSMPLSSSRFFLGAGENDPMVPMADTLALKAHLEQAGATATLHTYSMGHRLTLEEIQDATAWYRT